MIQFCLNPFALVAHNGFSAFRCQRFPRLFFCLTHLIPGLPALALWVMFHHLGDALVLAAAGVVVDKLFNWHTGAWRGFVVKNWADFFADFGMTCLALTLPSLARGPEHVLLFTASVYGLSIFQDPFP